jgi:hypothetical protein
MAYVETQVEQLRRAAGADRGDREMALDTKGENDPKREVKIKFVRNTSDGGEDYGPDYPKKVALVPFHRAAAYIRQGRAVAVDKDDELQEVEESAREDGRLPEAKSAGSKKGGK